MRDKFFINRHPCNEHYQGKFAESLSQRGWGRFLEVGCLSQDLRYKQAKRKERSYQIEGLACAKALGMERSREPL
uniref:Macaca fascicularis brain cDNA, clone: QmoA-11032 n=1 Tax=Macaca fascicularis TaxID=9541 RepID=I7GE49_MACFA|nr:unnamed protein product [Macaca fascicularis]